MTRLDWLQMWLWVGVMMFVIGSMLVYNVYVVI